MSLEWTHPINNQHEYYNLLESLQHCCFVACRSWDLCSEFDNEWRDNIIYARVRDVKLKQKSPKLYKVVHVMTADEHSGSVRGNFPTGRLVSSCHLTWNSECDVINMLTEHWTATPRSPPRQSPGRAAWSPRSHSWSPLRTPAWWGSSGSSTPPRQSRRSRGRPGLWWTLLRTENMIKNPVSLKETVWLRVIKI